MLDPDEYLPPNTFSWCENALEAVGVHGTIRFQDTTAEHEAVHIFAYQYLRQRIQLLHHTENPFLTLCTVPTGAYTWQPVIQQEGIVIVPDIGDEFPPLELEEDDREDENDAVDAVDQDVDDLDSSDTEEEVG